MVYVKVSLYLVTGGRIARLQKTIAFAVLPRVREFVKVLNRVHGDYFAFQVVQVTHREEGSPEIWLQLTTLKDGKSVVDFFEETELDEYLTSYQREGWILASVRPNRTFRADETSVWSSVAAERETESS